MAVTVQADHNEFLLTEKYRPTRVSDCILPERIKETFQAFVNSKSVPNMVLAGTPGTGKTTVALAMCDEIGVTWLKINASKQRGIDTLRNEISQFASSVSFDGSSKVIILDEADYLTSEAQAAFRGVVEEFSSNCTFILTCNTPGKLMEAIFSRCPQIDFVYSKDERIKLSTQFFKRCCAILDAEKITYSKSALVKVVNKHFPDFRRTLGELQNLAATNSITDDVIDDMLDQAKMHDLYVYLRDKEWQKMRKWVGLSRADPHKIFREIYDNMYSYVQSDSLPIVVLLMAKYQDFASRVVDQEINLAAFLTEMMGECEFTAF